MNQWGIWMSNASGYTGWLGIAAGGRFVPILFDESEARSRAAHFSAEARIVPENERDTEWNERVWKEKFAK